MPSGIARTHYGANVWLTLPKRGDCQVIAIYPYILVDRLRLLSEPINRIPKSPLKNLSHILSRAYLVKLLGGQISLDLC